MSSNEELQSTNEELETAKEEMQSTNEELTTLNDELESRGGEMAQVNNDLHNLLVSVHIPLVIVGPDLRIRRFTTIAEKTLNSLPRRRPAARGHQAQCGVPGLDRHIADVIDSLQTRRWRSRIARPLVVGPHPPLQDHRPQNRRRGRHVRGYRPVKMGLERTTTDREYAVALINTVREPVVALDDNLIVEAANRAFYNMFNVHPKETLNRRITSSETANGTFRNCARCWRYPAAQRAFEDFAVEHTFRVSARSGCSSTPPFGRGPDKTGMILLAIEDVTAKVGR